MKTKQLEEWANNLTLKDRLKIQKFMALTYYAEIDDANKQV